MCGQAFNFQPSPEHPKPWQLPVLTIPEPTISYSAGTPRWPRAPDNCCRGGKVKILQFYILAAKLFIVFIHRAKTENWARNFIFSHCTQTQSHPKPSNTEYKIDPRLSHWWYLNSKIIINYMTLWREDFVFYPQTLLCCLTRVYVCSCSKCPCREVVTRMAPRSRQRWRWWWCHLLLFARQRFYVLSGSRLRPGAIKPSRAGGVWRVGSASAPGSAVSMVWTKFRSNFHNIWRKPPFLEDTNCWCKVNGR